MKKKTDIAKILSFVVIHAIEIAILSVFTWWVLTYGPAEYKWPIVLLFVAVYLVYFATSLIEDYKSYRGGDFMV